ncbi:hypothetical protein PSACC_00889 [Paramicrosporidium saccamoebae]|uniref:Uncharacterized protein n=1 Tax=Paramicrosporidium saccamoebae TaxID=1246581 RepID=A0A2H9TNH9_9FUNG|nr:hypothetical protein PSACC_00889 [Paramicrosporidium saccamoebae]
MKLSLVAFCLFLSNKLTYGASLKIDTKEQNFWEFSKGQTLEKFRVTVRQMVKRNCRDILKNMPDMHMLSVDKQVWYTAAYYKTCWQANAGLVSTKDLESNIDSIVLADNSKFVADLPPSISSMLTNPMLLAQYDAVGLAKTWSHLEVFESEKMKQRKLSPPKILELIEARKRESFNLESAIKNNQLSTLDRYIKEEVWTPCMDNIYIAIKCNAKNSLLYLLKKVQKIPSAYWLDLLITKNWHEALEYIKESNPGWEPSQEDIDEACAYGWESVLKFYFGMNPDKRPSSAALLKAQLLNRFGVLEFSLERWYQYCLATLKPSCALKQFQIDNAAARGNWRFLGWCADCNPSMLPPSRDALGEARKSGHHNVIDWTYSRFPGVYNDLV